VRDGGGIIGRSAGRREHEDVRHCAVNRVTIAPTIHSNVGTHGGTWWDINGQTLSVPFRSIQPLYTRDVSIPGLHAHDAFITSLTVVRS